MIKRLKFLAVEAIAAVLVACGGGDDDTPNFTGAYQVNTLKLTSNTCANPPPATIEAGNDFVVQDGRNVTASDGQVHGVLDEDNGGFTFTETSVTNGVTVVTTFKFRVTATGATTFTVVLTSTGSCSLTYTGTATKV